MQRLSLLIARFSLAAWVGAAALFVITGVREVRSDQIDGTTKDVLVLIRFPSYYTFGFVSVGAAMLATAVFTSTSPSKTRGVVAGSLIAIALVLMAADYHSIYQPLVDVITPPGQPRSQQFERLHNASKWINMADVSLCLVAASMMCAPTRSELPESESKSTSA